MPEIFYHINRQVAYSSLPLLKIGDTLTIGDSINPYFNYYETGRFETEVDLNDGRKGTGPALTALKYIASGQATHAKLPQLAYHIAEYLLTLSRELIWEEVRRTEFETLPSRQKCLWLISNQELVEQWIQRIGCHPGKYQIVKVAADDNS